MTRCETQTINDKMSVEVERCYVNNEEDDDVFVNQQCVDISRHCCV